MTAIAPSFRISHRAWALLLGTTTAAALIAVVMYQEFAGRQANDLVSFSADSPDDYHSIATVVAQSDRILLATYVDARTQEVDLTPAVPSDVHESRTDVIWQFEVVEAVRGPLSPGEIQEVSNTPEVRIPADGARPAYAITSEILSLKPGQQYVLFLREGREQDGSTVWGLAGTPGIAAFGDADALEFLVTDRYVNSARELGLIGGSERVPFTATLDEVRAEAAKPLPTPAP